MGNKSKRRRKAFQAKRRREKKNPPFLNVNSHEWKSPNRSPFAVGYTVPDNTTPEQEALWVKLLKEAHQSSLGKAEQPPKLPKPTKKPAKPKVKGKKEKKIKLKRYKVEISLIGTEL